MPHFHFEPPTPTVTITPWDLLHSLGVQVGQTSPNSQVWGGIGRAVYLPFVLWRPATAYTMFWVNGTTLSGNVDAGIYDRTGLKLASIGSTTQAGASDMQEVAFASPVNLGAGYFFMALALDNNVGHIFRRGLGSPEHMAAGGYQENSAFPLPNQATLNSVSSSLVPLMGVRFYNA
jgi:hypothetical protein